MVFVHQHFDAWPSKAKILAVVIAPPTLSRSANVRTVQREQRREGAMLSSDRQEEANKGTVKGLRRRKGQALQEPATVLEATALHVHELDSHRRRKCRLFCNGRVQRAGSSSSLDFLERLSWSMLLVGKRSFSWFDARLLLCVCKVRFSTRITHTQHTRHAACSSCTTRPHLRQPVRVLVLDARLQLEFQAL